VALRQPPVSVLNSHIIIIIIIIIIMQSLSVGHNDDESQGEESPPPLRQRTYMTFLVGRILQYCLHVKLWPSR